MKAQNLLLIVIIYLKIVYVAASAYNCDQKELRQCTAKYYSMYSSTTITLAFTNEELQKVCSGLRAIEDCITDYINNCIEVQDRRTFRDIYSGFSSYYQEVCIESESQQQFMKHASCLMNGKTELDSCSKTLSKSMNSIGNPTAEQHEDYLKNVCCSMQDMIDCIEETGRKICGEETGKYYSELVQKLTGKTMMISCRQEACSSSIIKTAWSIVPLLLVYFGTYYFINH